jgi:hypothetical protein
VLLALAEMHGHWSQALQMHAHRLLQRGTRDTTAPLLAAPSLLGAPCKLSSLSSHPREAGERTPADTGLREAIAGSSAACIGGVQRSLQHLGCPQLLSGIAMASWGSAVAPAVAAGAAAQVGQWSAALEVSDFHRWSSDWTHH